jgi:hypothetical protein
MIARLVPIAAILALAASCAPQAEAPSASASAQSPRDCFFLSQISGYTHAGRDKIRVSTGPGRTYEFETLGMCPELDDAEVMGFDPAGPGTICRGIDIDLIVPTSIGPRRCAVKMISRVEQDEKKAS